MNGAVDYLTILLVLGLYVVAGGNELDSVKTFTVIGLIFTVRNPFMALVQVTTSTHMIGVWEILS